MKTYIVKLPRPIKQIIMLVHDCLFLTLVALVSWSSYYSLLGGWPIFADELFTLMATLIMAGSISSLLTIPVVRYFGLYNIVVRHMNETAVVSASKVSLTSTAIFVATSIVFNLPYQWPVILLYFTLNFLVLGGSRFVVRRYAKILTRTKPAVIIFGAGELGTQLLKVLNNGNDYRPVALVDDDPALIGKTVDGVMIWGRNQLPHLIYRFDASQLLLAIADISDNCISSIFEIVRHLPVQVKIIPSMMDLFSGRAVVQPLQDTNNASSGVSLRKMSEDQGGDGRTDLLFQREVITPNQTFILKLTQGALSANARMSTLDAVDIRLALEKCNRTPIKKSVADNSMLANYFANEKILIMGAGSLIGRGLACWYLEWFSGQVLLMDQSEALLMSARAQLSKVFPELVEAELDAKVRRCRVSFLKTNYFDIESIESLLEQFKVDRVIYCVADQQVTLSEASVVNVVQNNVLLLERLLPVVSSVGTPYFMLISTDKAVRPTSVVGATRRIQELLVLRAAQHSLVDPTSDQQHSLAVGMESTGNLLSTKKGRHLSSTKSSSHSKPYTCFSIARLGNLLEDEHSVVANFRRQIAQGGPVTVTHPNARRHFIALEEAVHLLLHANKIMKSGEVYVLDMGQSVLINDLARHMINLALCDSYANHQSFSGISLSYTGLRPGEKLFEESLVADNAEGTVHPHILKAVESCCSETLVVLIDELRRACKKLDVPRILSLLESADLGYRADSELADILWLQAQRVAQEKEIQRPRLRTVPKYVKDHDPA